MPSPTIMNYVLQRDFSPYETSDVIDARNWRALFQKNWRTEVAALNTFALGAISVGTLLLLIIGITSQGDGPGFEAWTILQKNNLQQFIMLLVAIIAAYLGFLGYRKFTTLTAENERALTRECDLIRDELRHRYDIHDVDVNRKQLFSTITDNEPSVRVFVTAQRPVFYRLRYDRIDDALTLFSEKEPELTLRTESAS